MVRQNGYTITSANSINFGRLVPQIAYYFTKLCSAAGAKGHCAALGEAVDFIVPTGNWRYFGGLVCKKMGLPVGTVNLRRAIRTIMLSHF